MYRVSHSTQSVLSKSMKEVLGESEITNYDVLLKYFVVVYFVMFRFIMFMDGVSFSTMRFWGL